MKSWMSFLLPDDEYKERKMLYFFSEGAILLFLSLFVMLIANKSLQLDAQTILLVAMGIFLFYVSGRYILSGIEYTDISTERAYKKELKATIMKTVGFIVIFLTIYLIIIGVPSSLDKWLEISGLLVSVCVVKFLSTYISLKRSYQKNKELM
jgi:NhaP-type Na+/H+ or K+/H+ antiporter